MTADFDFEFDDLRPLSWADAFPWLAGVAGPNGEPWWRQSIEDTDPITRWNRLATVSELAMERLTLWTIGQIFPGLDPDIDLLQITQLPVRARNALNRFGCPTSGQLLAVTLDDMLTWRNVGVGTVDAILQILADRSTSLSTPSVTNDTRSLASNKRLPHLTDEDFEELGLYLSSPEAEKSPYIDDLFLLADWYGTVGLPGQTLLGGPVPPGTPDEIIEARQRLESLSAEDLLGPDAMPADVASLFEDALDMLDPRAVQILGDRLFADDPVTLDQLGKTHGVTRERIRQIEGKARGSMLTFISEEGPLAKVAEAARALIGTIRPLEDVLALVPALGREVANVRQPAWRVLDRLDDAYEIEDGWCVVPTMTAAVAITQAQLQEGADQYGVLRLEDLNLVQTSQPERLGELTGAWLAHCGYIVDGDFVLTRTASVGDYGAAVLAIEGSPLSTQEILDRFVFERSAGSLRNAMGTDDRFERVDRDRWALTEWGMESYGGIRSVIRELVARGHGRARLNDVVEYITERYSVTASSVVAYAGAAPFMTRDGIVQVAGMDQGNRKPPQRTRRIFRRPDAWAYRVRITTEHLRGSGSVAPMAIATILELQSGETRQLESNLGPQAIAWTSLQPSFGTIRRFLMAEDVAAGTEAFLIIHDDGTFSFEQARDLVDNPLVDALSLVGAAATRDRETARRALADAIKLPENSPVTSVIGGYRERGDDDIAELLMSVREYLETGHEPTDSKHSADVDEILDLL